MYIASISGEGANGRAPDRDVDPRPLKTRISGDAQRQDLDLWSADGIKQEYKFVDEAAKLSIKEVSRSLTTSATSTRCPSPSLDFSPESAESGSVTPPSSTCGCEM